MRRDSIVGGGGGGEEAEEGRVCGGMRDTVERVRMRTLAHLQRWAHRHI